MERESNGDTNCDWGAQYSHQRIDKGTGGLGDKRMSGNHHGYSITKICENTENRTEDLRKLAVSQTPVKYHQLTLV